MKSFKELSEALVSNWNPKKHGEIAVGREAMYKGDDVKILAIDGDTIRIGKKNCRCPAKNVSLQDFVKNATPFPITERALAEDAPANVSGGTGINAPNPTMANIDKPLVKREKFANKEVFEVDDNFYNKCIHGKAKYAKYSAYVGDDHTGEAIRQYGRANPKASIIVKNKNTQNMMYLRRINEETGEEMMEPFNSIVEATLISVKDPQDLLKNNDYQFFVVVGNTIASGWEFRDDAKDDARDNRDGNAKFAGVAATKGMVYARRALKLNVDESTQLNEWGSHILATIELEKGQKGYLTRIPKTFKTKEKNVFIFYPNDRENGWQRAIKIDTKKGQYWDNIADEHEYDYAFNHGAGDKYKNLELSGQAKQTIKSFDEFLSEDTLDEGRKWIETYYFDDVSGKYVPHLGSDGSSVYKSKSDVVAHIAHLKRLKAISPQLFKKEVIIKVDGQKDIKVDLNEETLDESVLAAAMIGLTGVAYAKGYYEMSKEVYQHLKATIESRRKLAKQEGHSGILADYASEINKVADKLEAIFAKAKITK